MYTLPEMITHNYHPERGRLRNICTLNDEDAENILDAVRATRTSNLKPDYLVRRRATEKWLLSERRKKFKNTPLEYPVYFFLGDFSDGKDLSRPHSLILPLLLFPPETLTFTYNDSMTSYTPALKHKYHGHVFTLEEIKNVIATVGMPKNDNFIEVQVWDSTPLCPYIIDTT